VISVIIDLLLPSRFVCGDGRYFHYSYDPDNAYRPFVVRVFECADCGTDLSASCDALYHLPGEVRPGVSTLIRGCARSTIL
jgi:hypothetical protein